MSATQSLSITFHCFPSLFIAFDHFSLISIVAARRMSSTIDLMSDDENDDLDPQDGSEESEGEDGSETDDDDDDEDDGSEESEESSSDDDDDYDIEGRYQNPDGASVREKGEPIFKYFRLKAVQEILVKKPTESFKCLAAYSKYMVIGGTSGAIYIMDVDGKQLLKEMQPHKKTVNEVVVDEREENIASCSDDGLSPPSLS